MAIPTKDSASTLKPKDVKLKQAVQGCKLVKLRFNLAGIASIAGISERTANSKQEMIEAFWSEESLTPDEDKKFIREKSIGLGIESIKELVQSVSGSEKTKLGLEYVLGVILGTYLKVETDLLDTAGSLKKVWTIGRYIANIHEMVCSYKTNEDGVPVHSVKVLYANYLLDSKNMNIVNLDKLFLRSPKFIIGEQSRMWLSTELLKKYIEVSTQALLKNTEKFLDVISNSNLNSLSVSSSHTLHQKGAIRATAQNNTNNSIYNSNNTTNDTKKPFFKVDVNYIYTMLVVKISIIKHFEQNSLFSLLKQAVKITKDEIHVPIRHRAKASEYLGRTYNVFCSLHSPERKMLGYIGYDISAAMQSISLQLIKATQDDYPMLWEYAHNKQYKKKIRTEIVEALGIDEEKVKSQLTAYANGSRKDIGLHAYYKTFRGESNRLRKAVLKYVSLHEPEVLERAQAQSKKWKALQKEVDWSDTESRESLKDTLAKSSVFFFVWTQYERDIRQAMLEVLYEDGIEVHDAVYSKMDIDEKVLETAIHDFTGLTITIEKEK